MVCMKNESSGAVRIELRVASTGKSTVYCSGLWLTIKPV